jgi:hypothetical protein
MQNSARPKQLGIVDNYPYFRTSAISQGNNNTKQHSENSESAHDPLQDDDAEGDAISSNGTERCQFFQLPNPFNCFVLPNTFFVL